MPAYFVFTREKITEPAEMELYQEQVRDTFAGHPVRILAAYGKHEDLEGPPNEGTVVAEFPTVEAAKTWYESPAYREVREHRFKGAVYRATLVQGL